MTKAGSDGLRGLESYAKQVFDSTHFNLLSRVEKLEKRLNKKAKNLEGEK